MKSRKKPRSLTAVTWLLILSIMGTWLVSMAVLTLVTAQEIYDHLYDKSIDFLDRVDSSELSLFYDRNEGRYHAHHEHPGLLEHRMLDSIYYNVNQSLSSIGRYGSGTLERSKLIRQISYPMETAILFYDGAGNLLHSSSDDTLYFEYFTQEEWAAHEDASSAKHYGWMDISAGKDADDPADDPFRFLREVAERDPGLYGISVLRVTGTFEGSELKPVAMHYVTDNEISAALAAHDPHGLGFSYSSQPSRLDKAGVLNWQLMFDHSAEYESAELVTVYLDRPRIWNSAGTPLTYNGQEYENLAALTLALDFPSTGDVANSSKPMLAARRLKLNDLLIFSGRDRRDYSNYNHQTDDLPETEYFLITVIRSNPLLCAVSALRNLYIVTGLLAAALLLTVRGRIRRYLIAPIAETAARMERHWGSLHLGGVHPPMWQEATQMAAGFDYAQDMRRMKDNEINRLKAALEYAKTAEQDRRQMTSNIAHELKTPLAVIHSYAEGLKEHIAEDKRDQYLDVILSETERTDAMVLEMLDLSRLEAGKVKLARDEFDLIALTRAIFDKLSLAIGAKELILSLDLPGSCTATADEGRIAQVIENFATNAVKYTPTGGKISVYIRSTSSSLTFAVENESSPLSEEALSKVWDTFYRTDDSRSGGGTGLGLAIAKNIITLHGGKCSVRNTKTGVEFSFTLPAL